VVGDNGLVVANMLGDEEEREEEAHVDVLVLVVPVPWLAGIEANKRETSEGVLVLVNIVAVDVVGDVVVVAPNKAGGTNEVIGEAHNVVDQARLGEAAMVGAVVQSHPNVGANESKKDGGGDVVDDNVIVIREGGEGHGGGNVESHAAPLRSSLEHLSPDTGLDSAVELGIIGERTRLEFDARVGDLGELGELLLDEVLPDVVGLKEIGGIPADRLTHEELASRVLRDEVGQIIGLAANDCDLLLRCLNCKEGGAT